MITALHKNQPEFIITRQTPSGTNRFQTVKNGRRTHLELLFFSLKILLNENFAMYFIAETKWDKEAEWLNDDECIKIKCATKHFEAINQSVNEVVKYAWVNAYKDTTKGQPFPQVFTDDRYKDTLILERL